MDTIVEPTGQSMYRLSSNIGPREHQASLSVLRELGHAIILVLSPMLSPFIGYSKCQADESACVMRIEQGIVCAGMFGWCLLPPTYLALLLDVLVVEGRPCLQLLQLVLQVSYLLVEILRMTTPGIILVLLYPYGHHNMVSPMCTI